MNKTPYKTLRYDFLGVETDGLRRPLRIRGIVATGVLLLLSIYSSGCSELSSLAGPDRLYSVADEVASLQPYLDDASVINTFLNEKSDGAAAGYRNAVITARMYAIDLEYSSYEARITREGQIIDFATKLTQGTLTTVASLIPVTATSQALSGAATAVNGVDTQYNTEILRNQIVQNIEASMRTARNEQASVLYANMYYTAAAYPIGMALSDVEAYYRAGTFQTGLITLTQTVGKAETDSKATQDATKPAASPDAAATVKANQAAANAKVAATAAKATCTKPQNLPQHGASIDAKPDRAVASAKARIQPMPTPTNTAAKGRSTAPLIN